ncbi:MAG: YybH family protein [Nitrososphaerales archaeon]
MIESVQKMIPAEWDESVTRWEEAYNRGDAAGVAAFYTEQASWCGSMSGVVKGRAAIEAALQKLMDAGLKTIKVQTVEAEIQGNQAYGVTRFQFFGPSGQPLYSGNALSVAERQGGKLRTHHHWAVGDPQPK